MVIKKKEFLKTSRFLDYIEKRDFTKLDLTDLFEEFSPEIKLKIKNDFPGVENIKILRLLYELEKVRDKYGIKIKNENGN